MTSSRIVFTYVYMALNYIHSITYCYCIWVNTRICKRPPYGQCNAIQDWNTTHTILWDYKCQAKRFLWIFLNCIILWKHYSYLRISEKFQIVYVESFDTQHLKKLQHIKAISTNFYVCKSITIILNPINTIQRQMLYGLYLMWIDFWRE